MLFCSPLYFQILAQCLAHTDSQIFFISCWKICYSKTYLCYLPSKQGDVLLPETEGIATKQRVLPPTSQCVLGLETWKGWKSAHKPPLSQW